MPAELATTLATTEADRLLQAEGVVRDYCGWHIAPLRAAEATLDGRGGYVITLPTLHLVDIVSITENGVAVNLEEITWSENGVVERSVQWDTKRGNIVVTFNHGHANVPPGVQAIVQSVAQRAVNNPGSLVRTQDGPFSDTYSQTGFNQSLPIALLDAEKAILDRYRIPRLA
jgi:hypothetical protein